MMEEDTQGYRSPEAAFAGAQAGYQLGGKPLRKFSLSRKDAAGRMGWMSPFLFPDKLERIRSAGFYPGAEADARIVLWLCTLKDASEFTPDDYRAGSFHPDMAFRQPDTATEKSRAWFESEKLDDPAGEKFAQAYVAYLSVMLDIDVSQFIVKAENTGAPTLDSPLPKVPPGRLETLSTSRASQPSPGTPRNSSGSECPGPKPSSTSRSGGNGSMSGGKRKGSRRARA